MKKLTALVMALILVLSMSVNAFADTKNTVVEVKIDESFEWTVPTNIALVSDGNGNYKQTGKIEFSNVVLLSTHEISVTTASANTYQIAQNAYTFIFDATNGTTATINGNGDLFFTAIMEDPTHANSTEKDTLTFTAVIQ